LKKDDLERYDFEFLQKNQNHLTLLGEKIFIQQLNLDKDKENASVCYKNGHNLFKKLYLCKKVDAIGSIINCLKKQTRF
jgi:hypothetical protein